MSFNSVGISLECRLWELLWRRKRRSKGGGGGGGTPCSVTRIRMRRRPARSKV
jgi:hypothetical protein